MFEDEQMNVSMRTILTHFLFDFKGFCDILAFLDKNMILCCYKRNCLGPLRFTAKREEEDDQPEPPAKLAKEEALVCARSTHSHEYG
jgi:hypothetical protein